MIENQLRNLSAYIDKIEGEKPLDFFCQQITFIQENITVESHDFLQVQEKIDTDLRTLFDKYRNKGISDEILIMLCYQHLLLFLKKQEIYSFAFELGLEPSLFKDKMRLLFKGKT